MDTTDTAQIEATARVVIDTFDDSVLGIYRYGSSVSGGLRLYSDLDVFVVIDRPTSAVQRRTLTEALLAISIPWGHPDVGRSIELTIVLADEVSKCRPDSKREYLYGDWMRDGYEAGTVPGPETDPDLAIRVATLLAGSVAVFGPPACELVGVVDRDAAIAAMTTSLPMLLADLSTDTANVLLTLARMWRTMVTGEIVPKDVAASWAIDRLPEQLRGPLDQARSWYLTGDPAVYDLSQGDLAPTVDHILNAGFPAQGLSSRGL